MYMYRVTEITSGKMYPFFELTYVCQNENNEWESCPEDEAKFITVPELGGVCRIFDDDVIDPDGGFIDCGHPIVKIIEDNGLFLCNLMHASEDHAVQLADIENSTMDLADTLDMTAVDTQDGLCELADTLDATLTDIQETLEKQARTISQLTARVKALEEAQKGK